MPDSCGRAGTREYARVTLYQTVTDVNVKVVKVGTGGVFIYTTDQRQCMSLAPPLSGDRIAALWDDDGSCSEVESVIQLNCSRQYM